MPAGNFATVASRILVFAVLVVVGQIQAVGPGGAEATGRGGYKTWRLRRDFTAGGEQSWRAALGRRQRRVRRSVCDAVGYRAVQRRRRRIHARRRRRLRVRRRVGALRPARVRVLRCMSGSTGLHAAARWERVRAACPRNRAGAAAREIASTCAGCSAGSWHHMHHTKPFPISTACSDT